MADSSLPMKTLGEVLSVVETGSRPSGGASSDTFGMPSLGGENITLEGSLDLESVRYISSDFFSSMRSGHLKPSDVLINKDGAQTGKVAIYCGEFQEAAINEHLYLLRGSNEVRQDYLYRVLLSENTQRAIRSFITGSAQPGLNRRFVDILIPIPSLDKQKIIVETLQNLDEVIQFTEDIIVKYEGVRVGFASDLLNIGVTYGGASEWRDECLENLVSLEYGSALGAEDRTGRGFPVYGSNGVVGHHEAALVTGPGVIVGRKGSVGVVQWSDEDFWPIDTTYWVNPKVDLNLRWMYECLRLIGLESMDSSTGVPGLNRNDAYECLVPVPPLKEQRRIARILDDIDNTILANRRWLEKLRQLRAGLAADLFSGKLRTVKV